MGTRARLAVAAAIGVAACRQLVGIGDEPPGAGGVAVDASVDGAPTCGGFAWTGGTCEACMQSHCCPEQTACRGDAICLTNLDCLAMCAGGDDVCRSKCISLPDAVMAPVASCQARSCATECGLRCGGVIGWQPGLTEVPDSSCTSCIYSGAACAANLRYSENIDCMTQQFCTENCSRLDDICFDSCFASDAGRACNLGDAGLGVAALNACRQACLSGPDWSCVGLVTWPATTTPKVTYALRAVSYSTGASIAGIRGRTCQQSDVPCSNPQVTTTSDGGGKLVFTIGAGFNGYTELVGPADAGDAGFAPELFFHYPPIVQSLDPGWDYDVVLLPTDVFTNLAIAAGTTIDTSLGVIYAEPMDCIGNPAPGVSFTASPLGSATPFYQVDGLPNGQAKATQLGPAVGGGFINLPPGFVTFVAHANGQVVATVTVDVRPNTLTYLKNLVPTP